MNICQRLIFCKIFKVSPPYEIFGMNICQILVFCKIFKLSHLLHIHSLQFLQTFSLTASNYMLVALALDRWLIVESSHLSWTHCTCCNYFLACYFEEYFPMILLHYLCIMVQILTIHFHACMLFFKVFLSILTEKVEHN